MPNEKIPLLQRLAEDGGPLWGYLWFILLAVWGGTANYISRARRNKNHVFSAAELMGEWAISGFAGLLSAYICHEMGLSFYATAVTAGIAGHMGGRALFLIEDVIRKRFPVLGEKDK
ncbi:phage holin family protein [Oceanimonas smirnovii]|uniref:phage holin family protein n=1 Tax=Oceanimonas smirnovii TaxID=264574 RepID=UPI0003675511|nr:phage holin family protein [Oceanimonas smirnovii]